jgi:branched-chain amino acid transport system ATP-binding protein
MTLVVEGFGKRFGGLVAVDSVSLTAEAGQVTALIGPNGAGKTTLLNLISGVMACDSGRMNLLGKDVTNATPHELAQRGLTRTYQSPQIFRDMNVLETVMVGAHLTGGASLLASMLRTGAVRREERSIEQRARTALHRTGVPDDLLERKTAELAYGVQRRVELARALATNAKVILLDEPAAGLNDGERHDVSVFIQGLARDGFAVLLVEHDMEMIMGISHKVVVMNSGRRIAVGTPAEVQANELVIEAYLGAKSDD